jgi:hypothetical protein
MQSHSGGFFLRICGHEIGWNVAARRTADPRRGAEAQHGRDLFNTWVSSA